MATAPEPAAPARPRRPETLGLLVILLAGFLLRVWLASRGSGLTMDSALYVRMAEGLRAGHPLSAPAHQGYPLLIALASLLGGGREWPGRLVSLAASLALIPLVWWTARRRLPALPSLAAAAMVAAHPLLAVYGGSIMTEASFLTLAFAGVSLLDRGRPGWGGALLGASWWVRPEAAVVAPLAILWAPLRGRARLIAALWVLAIALPHSLVLTAAEGRWTLTPKTSLVRAPFEGARSAEWRLADPTAFADTVGLEQRLARDGRSIARAYPARLFAHAARAWARDVRGRVLAAAVLLAGLVGLWSPGPASTRALAFDDGPMAAMRGAGAWLAGHSRADAVVMDRKSYVPFFANRRHVQLPDEPLGVMLDFARDSGASHLVVEEYVVRSLRPQLAPLLDADSIRAERRVRLVFATRPAPGDGVAVFEVVR